MRLSISKFKKSEEGSAVILAVLVIFFALGMGGLAVDASNLYRVKGELQKAANSAAISGAQQYFKGTITVQSTVEDILNENRSLDNLVESYPVIANNKVTVKLNENVETNFMSLFGINSLPVTVTASAIVAPLSGASGAVPIGMPDDTVLLTGDTYNLNYSPGKGEQGNFEFLDMSNVTDMNGNTVIDPSGPPSSGAGALYYYITSGFGPELDVEYNIMTKTGIDAGKVKKAIQDRMAAGSTYMIILLYDHSDISSGKSSRTITGFAAFELLGIDNKVITGKFIELVANGNANENAENKGVYGIKLVE
jgi:Flp pilus assembly protein TadG